MPKVSVIIPVYNAEDYLGQCLDSVLMQTLEDIEVICIDDGSTDNSLETLQGYSFLDSRLKVIHQENKGPGAARNRGIKEATGEFMMFLDADDFFEADMIEKMVKKAEEDASDVVVCGHYVFDNTIKETVKRVQIKEEYLKKSPARPEDFGKELLLFSNPCAWNKLIRSRLIHEQNIFFDETVHYVDDQMFTSWILIAANKISTIKNSFIYYRININTQQTTVFKKDFVEDSLKTLTNLYTNLKKNHLYEKFQKACIYRSIDLLRNSFAENSFKNKRKNLNLISKQLPKEMYESQFFVSSLEKRVSIIIPVYNAAEFLPECLDSCLHQTLTDIEIICVDDGSTDNSLEILNQYAQKDKRIIVLQQENQRQAIARNKAMEVATGRFIQFLDADDYLEPDACECLYLYSEIFGLDMCQCTAIEFYNHNKKEFENPYHCLSWMPDNYQAVFNRHTLGDLLPQMAVTAWLTFYRRGFLERNNIQWINKKIPYEDTPFFVEAILKAKRVGALKAPFYHRRVHKMATTQQITTNYDEYMFIIRYTLDLIKKYGTVEILKAYCDMFSQKAWGIFGQFEITDKVKMAPELYKLFLYLIQKQSFKLPPDMNAWCLRYLKNKKKEKFKFQFYNFILKLKRNEYTINLISFKRPPFLTFKVFGIPVLYSKILLTRKEGKKKTEIFMETYIKFLGLTLLKIKEKEND